MSLGLLRKASQAILGRKKNSDGPHSGVPPHHTQDIQNNENCSRNTIPLPASSSDIPRKILAFRTITATLSKIQKQEFQIKQVTHLAPTERHDLKILNAFSTVAVIHNEVVAAVASNFANELQVIACTQTLISKGPLITPPQAGLVSTFWNLLAAQNSRRSDDPYLHCPVGEPTITNAEDLADYKFVDDETLKKHINEHWSQPDIAKHLWFLSKLLTMKDPSPDGPKIQPGVLSERLLRYVIATCYEKMIQRLRHKTLSLPYSESLKGLNPSKFVAHSEPASPAEADNDRLFLLKVVLLAHDKFDTKTPNLVKTAKLAEANKSFELYTEDTYMEFHNLLNELLRRFRDNLLELAKCRGKSKYSSAALPAFEKQVTLVMGSGYALHKIAKGSALRMHMHAIASQLEQARLQAGISKSMPAPGEEDEELDEELVAVQPFVNISGIVTPLWRSYVDWLRLMVAHFDAVDILVTYVTGTNLQDRRISVRILVAPPVDKRKLLWRELFTDSTLFPTKTVWDPPSAKPHAAITNDGILDFLNGALESCSQVKNLNALWKKEHLSANDHKDIIRELRTLESSQVPGWKDCATKLLAIVNVPNINKLTSDANDTISDNIQRLLDSSKFFTFLSESDGEESTPNFEGSLHCEAFIASLLDKTTRGSADISAQLEGCGPIIGVSKRCCPPCQYLLSLLSTKGLPFIVRGSHNTVTACTLPGWLPMDIVDSMNKYFGDQLRRELVTLMDSSSFMRMRAQSNGSHRLSSDSTEVTNEALDLPKDYYNYDRRL